MSTNKINTKIVYKAVGIIYFTLLFILLYTIVKIGAAGGYELSIYEAYPSYFWVIIIFSYLLAISILVPIAIFKIDIQLWKFGFFIINITTLLVLSLQYFRGYVLYGRGNSDILTHIGFIRDILSYGHISSNNLYPIIHLISTIIIYVGNVSIEKSVTIIQLIFSLLYIIGFYLLASTFKKQSYTVIVIAFASPLMFSYFHLTFHPAIFSLFIIPYFFYFYQKIVENNSPNKRQNTLLLLIFTFLITFFHPSTLLIMIILFIPVTLYKNYSNITHNKNSPTMNNSLIIMIIVFFTWYFSFVGITNTFKKTIKFLWYEIGNSAFSANAESIKSTDMTIYQFIDYGIKIYGSIVIYNLIFVILISILVKNYLQGKKIINSNIIQYIIFCIISYLVGITFLFNNFVENEPLRIFRFVIFFISLLNGILLLSFVNNKTNKHLYAFVIILIIGSATIISLFNVYDSSITGRPNNQLTYMELSGVKWFISNSNKEILTISSHIKLDRYEDMFYGFSDTNTIRQKKSGFFIPSHFGYNSNNSLSDTIGKDKYYMIITEVDKQFPNIYPTNIREKTNQYDEKDFNKLYVDKNVSEIYSNKEFIIYIIN